MSSVQQVNGTPHMPTLSNWRLASPRNAVLEPHQTRWPNTLCRTCEFHVNLFMDDHCLCSRKQPELKK
eukprot:10755321-Karenia_brevis.AAC.1